MGFHLDPLLKQYILSSDRKYIKEWAMWIYGGNGSHYLHFHFMKTHACLFQLSLTTPSQSFYLPPHDPDNIMGYSLLLNVQRIQILGLFSLTRDEKCPIKLWVMWFCLCQYFTIQISGILHSLGDSSSSSLKYRSCTMIGKVSWNIKKIQIRLPWFCIYWLRLTYTLRSFCINTGIFIFLQTVPHVSPNRCSNKILKLIGPKVLWVIKEKTKQNKN